MDLYLDKIEEFHNEKHKAYLKMMLMKWPEQLLSADCNKMFLLYFILAANDIMEQTNNLPFPKSELIDYIYSLQYVPANIEDESQVKKAGFLGGEFLGYNHGNIVYTYPAIACLKILGDDLSRLDKRSIIKALKELQADNGGFRPYYNNQIIDIKYLFAACAVAYLLNDWSTIDKAKAISFVRSCQVYDGGYGFNQLQESHGSATYLAIASMKLMDALNELTDVERTIQWCINRQQNGMQGRIGKIPDACYSFWIGATLQILGYQDLLNPEQIAPALLECQNLKFGGLMKYPFSKFPDPVHTLHGLYGLCILKQHKLQPIRAEIGLLESRFKSDDL